MSKEQLLERLKDAFLSSDTEAAHYDADNALIAYINDPDITAAYEAVKKWYA